MVSTKTSPASRTRDDLVHLLAYFAVLHRSGAALITYRGGWHLLVETVAGPVAWPIRDEDLGLFDRVTRVDPRDERTTDLVAATADRNTRLEALIEATWQGTSGIIPRRDRSSGSA